MATLYDNPVRENSTLNMKLSAAMCYGWSPTFLSPTVLTALHRRSNAILRITDPETIDKSSGNAIEASDHS